MTENNTRVFCRSKVWLVDEEGNVVFGVGRLRILEAIKSSGSIHQAAKDLKMSYRAVWSRIHATESRLGVKLLEKKIGGAAGGGSHLTPLAERLISNFRSVQASVEKETDRLLVREIGEDLDIRAPNVDRV